MGRMFFNNLMALGVLDEAREIFAEKGFDLNNFEDVEDAALGNGGLGRLAACYLDRTANLGYPMRGYGIRYKYGLFKQRFEDGRQIEEADDWLKVWGDTWSVRRADEKIEVHFADMDVTAVPYDLPMYVKALLRANSAYQDKALFVRQQLINATHSAYFSSDRAVEEYARNIWKISTKP